MQHNYFIWPGAYNFKQEIGLLLAYVKEQIDLLLFEIAEKERQLLQ